MRNWIEPKSVQVSDEILALVDGNRLLAEMLVRRGYSSLAAARAFLYSSAYQPASPFDLPGMTQAVERLKQAVQDGQKVLIWGDFDVDGQTATTLLVTALRECGARVTFYIPDRLSEGHGLHAERLRDLFDQDNIQLVMTCDTGIAAHEAIVYANSRQVDVIVTDHHQLPDILPPALVCVNPQMLAATHPLHTLPGAGCAFKVIEALFNEIRPDVQVDKFLDLVALGIVADIAVQTGDTRYLLQHGLIKLRETPRVGLLIMTELAGIDPGTLDEEQISFGIAPRLNALGRLGNANDAVELLSTNDEGRARILANRLEGYNNERRLLTQQIFDSAVSQINENPALLDAEVLIVTHPLWATGVLGIVANRLVEQYMRPTVVIATPLDHLAHGSARSIEGVDITAAIGRCSHLLSGSGGHTMAAGVTLAPENIDAFRRALSRAVRDQKPADIALRGLSIDSYVRLAEITPELLASLKILAPFGPGNPPVMLVIKRLILRNAQPLGRSEEHYRLTVEDETGVSGKVVWWRVDRKFLPDDGSLFDLACTLHINKYQGKSEIQIELADIRLIEDQSTRRQFDFKLIDVHDYRAVEHPETILPQLIDSSKSICIWNEGDEIPGIASLRRHELYPCEKLIVWSTPASPQIWQEILMKSMPNKVDLIAIMPIQQNTIDTYFKRAAGLIKYALQRYDGQIVLQQLAGLTGQTDEIIDLTLEWLSPQMRFRIVSKETDKVKLDQAAVNAVSVEMQIKLKRRIELLMKESRAYQVYFRQAHSDAILMR